MDEIKDVKIASNLATGLVTANFLLLGLAAFPLGGLLVVALAGLGGAVAGAALSTPVNAMEAMRNKYYPNGSPKPNHSPN